MTEFGLGSSLNNGYDMFADQTANLQRGVNDSMYKAFEPIKVDGQGMGLQGGMNQSPAQPNWFGEGGYLSTGANVAQGLGGLMGAYTGWKNLGLAKDQFNFEKAATNRNLANQGQMINTAYQNAGDVGLTLAGGTLSPEQRAAEQEKIKAKYVSTAPIG